MKREMPPQSPPSSAGVAGSPPGRWQLDRIVAELLRWSEASAFGNFLEAFSPSEREQIRGAFARLVETKRTPEGLPLERYLRFAFAHKPSTRN